MIFNIVVDVIIGLIPILGDVADASFRANSKNVRLLEKRLDEVYKPDSVKKRHSLLSSPPLPASEYEDFDDERLPRHRQDTEEYRKDINVDRQRHRQDTDEYLKDINIDRSRHRQDTEEYFKDINVDGRHAYRQDTDLSQPAPARIPTETRGGERTDRRGGKLNKNSKRSRR